MICCVGSAHIDIIARQTGQIGVDQVGDIHVSVGGTAYNVACNLRKYGVSVSLVTALKDSLFGNIIINKLKSYGIQTKYIIESSHIKESLFLSITGQNDMLCAVNQVVIEEIVLTNIPDAQAYFVDLNNNIETVKNVIEKNKPTYINLVSEEKAIKLVPILHKKQYKNLKAISGNSKEFANLVKELGVKNLKYLSAIYPDTIFIYTMAEKGLKVYKNGKLIYKRPANYLPDQIDNKYINGAGDALIAGYIYATEIKKTNNTIEAIELALQNFVVVKLLTQGANIIESNVISNLSTVIYVDQLTGLYNRSFFENKRTIIEKNKTIILADVDNFKQINDTFGHNAGDKVLKTIADIIRRNIRQNDIALRWGGEEFIIFCNTDLKGAITVAERLRKAIENAKITYNSHTLRITLSIGVSTIKQELSIYECIEEADKKLYEAKRTGKNKVVY